MAKVGYIMAISQYDKLEEDRKWMNEFGCVRIVEENDENERNRPLWKQLMVALKRGDELVIPKFSNALRGSRELATFLEFCRVKVIRIISIHDKIDSNNILFPETKPSDVLTMMGALPEEVLALRKSAEHVVDLQEKMIVSLPKVSSAKMNKLDREKTVINLYVAGHPIDDIWRASGFKSRSSVFRILNKHGIKLNRGNHSGPIKKSRTNSKTRHRRIDNEENTIPAWFLCDRQLPYGECYERGFRRVCCRTNSGLAFASQRVIEGDSLHHRQRAS